MNFACTLCGSRNWPREDADCPLCRADEPEEPDQDQPDDENEHE